MREVVSIIVLLIITAIVYEVFKPKKDYKSTNQLYDSEGQKEE